MTGFVARTIPEPLHDYEAWYIKKLDANDPIDSLHSNGPADGGEATDTHA